MSVRIITDSASDMSPAEHPALRVLPLSVTFGTDVYMDGVDIDHQRFYEMLVERDELPKTGQVNPYAFSQAIAEAREAGDEAVIITVGAKLSGTNQSARTALAEAPGGDMFVVDSNNVTLGERVLVEYALRLVDEGQGAAQIAAAVEAVRDRVVVIGLLETLEYLVRGGRLSAAAGAVGTLLNVKPVVAAEDGLIVQLGKARGSKNGRNLLNQKVEKAGGIDFSMPLALGYTGLSDAVLKKYIEDSAALWAGHAESELPIHTIGATIGTEHLNACHGAFIAQMDAVFGRLNGLVGTEDTLEETAFGLDLGFIGGVKVADDEVAGGTVAVDKLKAHAVDEEPRGAPGAVKRFLEDDCLKRAVGSLHDIAAGLALGDVLNNGRIGLLDRLGIGIELLVDADGQTLEHFGLHRRIGGTGLPDRGVALRASDDLNHRTMRQEDVTRAVVIALDAATVLIAFARGVGEVEHLADRAADDVLRELGLVFGPFGLKVAGLGVLTTNREADARPQTKNKV